MRNEQTSKRRIPWRLVWLCGGTLALFGAAAPASAGDTNFERGFERELGRILAHEAVNAGKAILFQGIVHPDAHLQYAGHRGHPRYYRGHHDRRHWRKHRRIEHRRWQRRQHRHHHGYPYQRRVRHGFYYYDDDDFRHRKLRKRDGRRRHRHDDDCDDRY